MATGAKLVGGEQLRKAILALSPGDRRKVVDPALREMALLVVSVAALQKIKRGDRKTRRGPASAPIKGVLTSRSGRLRSSLGADDALDESGLPRGFIEAGSDVEYAGVHEYGNATHPPRPFLKPALDDSYQKFDDIFIKHWARAAQL